MGGAASYIHAKNQSPPEMCVCSVLATTAIVSQGLYDVCWREGKISPISLNIVVEAESGERKSANDDEARPYLRAFDEEQAALESDYNLTFDIEYKLWKLRIKETSKLIAKLTAKGQCTEEEEEQLQDLVSQEPQRRKFARMLITEATQAALGHHLRHVYSNCGLDNDEGITVLKSGILRDFGMHNKMWDNGTWSSSRVGSGRTELRNCRFSSYWQIQPDIMDGVLRKGGNHYHATGYSSRSLHVRANSTQGTRDKKFVEVREEDIQPFHMRINELLDMYRGPDLPTRKVLTLSKAATELLSWFDDEKEKAIGEGGWFFHMRAAASKSPENAARLAAHLQVMEKLDGPIGVEVMRNAIVLTAYFLNQHRMRFCPLSQLELDMSAMEEFVTYRIPPSYVRNGMIDGPDLCRIGPRHLRPVDRLWEVLKALELTGKVKLFGAKGSLWRVEVVARTSRYFEEPPAGTATIFPRLKVSLDPSSMPPPPSPPQIVVPGNSYELWPRVYLE
ncbi:MAG: DUF3987 domain-containing protein [Pseudomonadota bacterium]